MSDAKPAPLAGLGIVVTRPAQQAAHLAGMIAAAGGKPILFPTVEIIAPDDLPPLLALIDRLDEFDLAIFISPSAASAALSLIKPRRSLPSRLKLAAIGDGGVRALSAFGVGPVIAPTARFDSEALLELPELQDVAGRHIVIFRGDGGRALLGDTLAARGARIEYAECYRRARPRADPAPLLDAWRRNELHAIVVTSSEAVQNLFEMVGADGGPRLRKTPLFVPHPRIERRARELGVDTVILTAQGDAGLVGGLAEWFAVQR